MFLNKEAFFQEFSIDKYATQYNSNTAKQKNWEPVFTEDAFSW